MSRDSIVYRDLSLEATVSQRLSTYDLSLRDPQLHEHARAQYRHALDHIVELTTRWRDAGHIQQTPTLKPLPQQSFR